MCEIVGKKACFEGTGSRCYTYLQSDTVRLTCTLLSGAFLTAAGRKPIDNSGGGRLIKVDPIGMPSWSLAASHE